MATERFYTRGLEHQGANYDLVEQARRLLDAASGDYPVDPSIPAAFDFKDTVNASRAEWQWHDAQTLEHERMVVNVVGESLIIALSHRHLQLPDMPFAAEHSQGSLLVGRGVYSDTIKTSEQFRLQLDHTMAALGIRAFVPKQDSQEQPTHQDEQERELLLAS